MRVIGVDPGSRATGWGIVDRHKRGLCGVAAGVIRAAQAPLEERIRTIHQGLTHILLEYQPDVMAIEDMYFAPRYAQAALRLGHARGVILLAAAERGLSVHAYPPAIVKRAIAGHGQAKKDQVARMVERMLDWKKVTQSDTTDALAIALTHLCTRMSRAAAAPSMPKRIAISTMPTDSLGHPPDSLPGFRSK